MMHSLRSNGRLGTAGYHRLRHMYRRAAPGFAIVLALMLGAPNAVAQDVTPPMPDTTYSSGAATFPSPTDIAVPPLDDFTNPDVVTVPIPGGGTITVDGPDAPSDTLRSPI